MLTVSVPGEHAFAVMRLGCNALPLPIPQPAEVVGGRVVRVAVHHGDLAELSAHAIADRRERLLIAARAAGWEVTRTPSALVERLTFTRGAERQSVLARRNDYGFWTSTAGALVGMIEVGVIEGAAWSSSPWRALSPRGHVWPVRGARFVHSDLEVPPQLGLWRLPPSLERVLRAELARLELEQSQAANIARGQS